MAVSLRHLATWSLVCVAVIFAGLVPARAGGEFGGSGKFTGWWELGGFYGTDDSSRGEVVLFTPLAQSASTLFFLDARGKLFEEDVQEANLALGYRQMMPSGWNLGLWAGWDIRDTEENNTFHQVAFGLEALSERYDLRVNGYVPVTDPKGSPGLAEVFLRGNNILMVGGEEVPLYGVDGEVGVLLFGGTRGGGGLKGAPAASKRHELRAYAGGFWFDADEALEEVAGPKGRLEYRINDIVSSLPGSRLTIESELSYDEVRDTKFEIGARLRIPFGARGSDAVSRMAALTGQELRMIEGLERDTDIITVQSEEENVLDTLTNVNFDRVGFVNGGGDVQGTLNANGPNSLVILDGGTTNGSVLVGPNQTLQGGGSTIQVTGVKSGTTANFTAPGTKPFLTQLLDQAVLTVDNNTHLAGLGITGAGAGSGLFDNDGIVPITDGVSNIAITQTMIMDMGGVGIDFGNDHNKVVISDTSVENTGNDGIEFFIDNSNLSFENVTIRNAGTEGFDFASRNTNVAFKRVAIDTPGNDGFDFNSNNSNVSFENVTIRNAGSRGIEFGSDSSNVTIANTTITTTGSFGIFFSSNSTNIGFTNVNVTDTGSDGIDFSGNSTNVAFTNVNITDTGSDGIDLNSDNTNITFSNVDITDARQGISFSTDNTNIAFSNVNITNTSSAGINFSSRNRDVTFSNVNTNTNSVGINFSANNTNVAFLNVTTSNNRDGINFTDGNTNISLMHVDVSDTSSNGITFTSDNTVTLSHVNVSQTGTDGIGFADRNTIAFTDVNITDAGDDALRFRNDNTVDINNTTFAGTIVDDILNVSGLGNTINGANNPNNAAVGGFVCNLNGGAGAFTGSVTIGNQTFVNGAGCNP